MGVSDWVEIGMLCISISCMSDLFSYLPMFGFYALLKF